MAGPLPSKRAALLVLGGICSVRTAAQAMNIKNKNKVQLAVTAIREGREPGTNGRPRSLARPELEQDLLTWIAERSKSRNYPEMSEIVAKAEEIRSEDKKTLGLPPASADPLSRNALLTILKDNVDGQYPRGIETERLITTDQLGEWFDHLEKLVAEKNYDPRLIWNWDETMGSVTSHYHAKVYTPRSIPKQKAHKQVLATRNEHTTVGIFIAASGDALPPQIIVPLSDVPAFTDQRLYNQAGFHGQEKGWINDVIMLDIIRSVFIPEIERRRKLMGQPNAPAVLMWDGHGSHTREEINQLLAKHNIDSVLFIAHASHILQPLDLVIFHCFKATLKKQLSAQLQKKSELYHGKAPQRRELFIACAISAIREATSYQSVIESFERAGLYPLNRNKPLGNPVVTETQELAAAATATATAKQKPDRPKPTRIRMSNGAGFYGGLEGVIAGKKPKLPPKKKTKKEESEEKSEETESEGSSEMESDDDALAAAETATIIPAKTSQISMEQLEAELDRRLIAISTHEGLQLQRHDVDHDGACQFHAVMAAIAQLPQLDRGWLPTTAAQLREVAVDWLEENADTELNPGTGGLSRVRDFQVGMGWHQYLKHMRRRDTWGEQLTLTAMSRALGLQINTIIIPSAREDEFFIATTPPQFNHTIWVGSLDNRHYEAVLHRHPQSQNSHNAPATSKRQRHPPRHLSGFK